MIRKIAEYQHGSFGRRTRRGAKVENLSLCEALDVLAPAPFQSVVHISFLSTFKRRKKAGAIPVRTVRLSPIFKLTSNNVSKGKEILTVGIIVDFYWFLELSK